MTEPAAETVEEALARARQHGRAAAAEGLAAVQALLEAGALASGRPATGDGSLATLRETLLRVRRWLDPDGGRDGALLLEGVSQALDEEIQRWEEKSKEDPDARTILRAFLAVREVVWEFSARPDGAAAADGARESGTPPRRVPVEG